MPNKKCYDSSALKIIAIVQGTEKIIAMGADRVSVNRYPWYPGDDADVEFKDAIIKSSL